jgi:hypothetical protein
MKKSLYPKKRLLIFSKGTMAAAAGLFLVGVISISVLAHGKPKNQPLISGSTRTNNTTAEAVAGATTPATESPSPADNQSAPAQASAQIAGPSNSSASTTAPVQQQPATQTPAVPNQTVEGPLPIGYDVVIDTAGAANDTPNQFHVPFNILRGQGHTNSIMFDAVITSAPVAAHDVSCTAVMKEGNLGFLLILVPDASPAGTYTCQLTLNDGLLTRTANYDFAVPFATVTP